MKTALSHALGVIRLVASNRSAHLLLVLLGMTSAFLWPDAREARVDLWIGQADQEGSVMLGVVGLLWLLFVPALLAMSVRPGSTRGGTTEIGSVPHPALPLGLRSRMMIEIVVGLGLVGVVRIPFVLLRDAIVGGRGFYPEFLTGSFLEGALLLLPVVLVCFGRSRSIEQYWFKATVFALVVLAIAASGAMVTLAGLVLFSAALSVPAVLSDGADLGRGIRRWNGLRVYPLNRSYRDPIRQLRRDFVLRPVPMILIFVTVELVAIAIRWYGYFDSLSFYLANTIIFSFSIGMVTLRPFGSSQSIAGVLGKAGCRPGDFGKAFSVLPVPRDLLLRTIYLHAWIAGAATWLAIIFVGAINARVALGEFLFFVDSRGDLTAEILLPMLALVPCAAGYLVEGTVGDRKAAFLLGGMLVLSPQVIIVMLIMDAPWGAFALVAIAVALIGGTLPLRHLRNTPAPEPSA